MVVYTVDVSLEFASTIGAYDTTEYSGLYSEDLLIEFSVYVARTVEQMMTGKQFNRAVRALTLVYEALSSLWLSAFFEW
jgi:hypothetical protein